jgi:hypothetical protein
MALQISNRGRGFIGEIGAGWNISQNGSPAIMGNQSGRFGALNFGAKCDSTTKFTIDNYLSVKHFYDDNTTRWLSTFDGHIRNVDTAGDFGTFTMNSLLSALDVQRTSSSDASGQYQRTLQLPAGLSYVANSVTYYTGGSWQTVDGAQVFVAKPITIYDVAAEDGYVYVLASGGHNGEVVFQVGMDGLTRSVWPVYSDATDLAAPGSSYIGYGSGYVFVGQVNADRIKRFTTAGVFQNQWGSAGTGNSQFNIIAGIGVNDGGDRVYVTDSVIGRVQSFNYAGTYQTQWGSLGTGTGNTVFNAPNGVSVDPYTGNVFVSDRNARVRQYTSTGTYVNQPMGSYTFTGAKSNGELVHGAYYIKTAFDQRGNAYAGQLGRVYKYARNGTTSSTWDLTSADKSVKNWATRGITDAVQPVMLTVGRNSGILHIAQGVDKVEQYAGSLGTLSAYVLYYIALATGDFPVRLLVLNDDMAAGVRAYTAWTGNVWDHLCQMMAATGNAIMAFDDRAIFTARTARNFTLPRDITPTPIQLDSRGAGLSVEVVNQNSRWTVGREVMYSAQADDNRTFSIDVAGYSQFTVNQDTYPEYLIAPIAGTSASAGIYTVVDSDLIAIDPEDWRRLGGSVKVALGDRPGDIIVSLTGPSIEIPSRKAPYKISTVGAAASLSIIGTGVIAKPETIRVGTGLSEEITNREVAQTIDYPYAQNAQIAYTQGGWAAYNSGTPNQRYTFSFRIDRTYPWADGGGGVGGTFQFVNVIVRYGDAEYIVEDVNYNATDITLTTYRYTKTGRTYGEDNPGRIEDIWNGSTAGEFDAYWAGYTAQDLTIAPLRNPFGV